MKRAIAIINHAVKELREARKYVRNNRPERAEDELADALRYIGKAIRQINRGE